MSILPSHKSAFDKKFDQFFGVNFAKLDLSVINTLADSCPARILPILAASFDVDIGGLDEEGARKIIKNAFEIHYYSGTFHSLSKALKAFYTDSKVLEWYDYGGEPYHFKLELEASNGGINKEKLVAADELVKRYKNVRSVYDGANIKISTDSKFYIGLASIGSQTIKIYPHQVKNIDTRSKFCIGLAVKFEETLKTKTLDLRGV